MQETQRGRWNSSVSLHVKIFSANCSDLLNFWNTCFWCCIPRALFIHQYTALSENALQIIIRPHSKCIIKCCQYILNSHMHSIALHKRVLHHPGFYSLIFGKYTLERFKIRTKLNVKDNREKVSHKTLHKEFQRGFQKVSLLANCISSENQSKPLCFKGEQSHSAVVLYVLLLDHRATEFGPN